MSLKTVTVYALECDYCHTRIPDRGERTGRLGYDRRLGRRAHVRLRMVGRHPGRPPLLHRMHPACRPG